MKLKKITNKKAVSEIVSYVLLIVIALSLAAGVYTFLKSSVPNTDNEREKCPEDTSMYVSDYECSTTETDKILTLTFENKGLFNVDGFIITATDNPNALAATMLNTTEGKAEEIQPGRYYFEPTLKLGDFRKANFSYTGLNSIAKIRVQPFVNGKTELLLCSSVSEVRIEDC